MPESQIKRVGTIKITDLVSGTSEIQATYAASDILRYLDMGYSIEKIVKILETEAGKQTFRLAW